MMKTQLLIGFALVVVSQCMIIKYKKCSSPASSAVVGDVVISPCDNQPCQFIRGGNANIQIHFQAKNDNSNITTIVKGKIGPLWVPFPLSQPDGCLNDGIICPVKTDQQYVYSYDLPISKSYPAISVVVSWELQDENGNDLVCIQFPIKLV
ncbi:NPC intracellular cholesterol transporter 2 [Hydra vulgaris]|uniref:NPC intracellular cholesterol transporter 2 n=1 Tax=Hydra vulgaris TaxID=6087 RepID=UPI001F5F4234|nr:NPC intracellular cholesterol transporter 2 [Hydra vulgaris]